MAVKSMHPESSIWRWLAAFLAGIVLAGFPAAFVSFTAPSRSDLERLRQEIVVSQLQIARLEERLLSQGQQNQFAIKSLQQQVESLKPRR